MEGPREERVLAAEGGEERTLGVGGREGGRRKGGGRVRVRHVGARERFCSPVSCLLLAGPPVWEPDPHPHPAGSGTGRGRLPLALSQEGLGAERERTAVKGPELMTSPSAPPLFPGHEKTGDPGPAPPSGSTKMPSATSDSVAPSEGQWPRDVLSQSLACSPSTQSVSPSRCLTSFPLAVSPVPGSQEME